MTVTRRLAAILAADVVGYSRLIGANEEGTLNRLKAIRAELIDPKIDEHRGRIVKTTGDGLLVEFGSVVDALRCGAEWQRDMAEYNIGTAADRIEFRIGVHQGDVVVEGDDIFGDGVNVAARLEGLAEPGGICVSARVQEDAAGRLDLAFEDLGDQSLKNIARQVRVYRVRLGTPDNRPKGMPVEGTNNLALPDKPSIAVLPFQNMSNDPEQEFFADGIAEDIITALSRYPSLFVIARNSCFTYKGRAVNVKQVGRELGVRYVLEGSLRKSGNRIRVTAQLVEAETGNHVWADGYDRDLGDIFAVQDEITQATTIAVAPAIAYAERQRAMRKPPASLDAWAAFQRGLWHLTPLTADDNALAEKFFRRSIELDSAFVGGHVGLAFALAGAGGTFQTQDFGEAQQAAEAAARRAVALGAADAEAHAALSSTLQMRGNFAGALSEAEQARALSPNLASVHGALSAMLIYSGRVQEGLAAHQICARLDPRDPRLGWRLHRVAFGYYFIGGYDAAKDAAEHAILSYPEFPTPYRVLAATLGQLGRTEEAKKALEQAIAVRPASFEWFVRERPPWFRPEDYAHMLDGLRKAGWGANHPVKTRFGTPDMGDEARRTYRGRSSRYRHTLVGPAARIKTE